MMGRRDSTAGATPDVDRSLARSGSAGRFLPHVPGLDGVRAIAVLMVMVRHTGLVFGRGKWFNYFPGGFLGVEIFFVLSGFLITSLLLNERQKNGNISLRGFYTRRALRLLPALVLLLGVHFVYVAVTDLNLHLEVRSDIVAMLYVTNWYVATGHAVAGGYRHLWSLSVEEQFYAVWPIVTIALLRFRSTRRFAVGFIAAGVVAFAAWRAAAWHDGTNFFVIDRVYNRTQVHADALLIGALAAYAWTQRRLHRQVLNVAATISAVFIAVCACRLPDTTGFYYKGGFTLVAIATAIVVLAVVDGAWIVGPLLSWAPLRAIGRVSYGLYLWHFPVFVAVQRYSKSWPSVDAIGLSFALTAACTVASWYLVETPFLRQKARLRLEAAG